MAIKRCDWANMNDPVCRTYHDQEWCKLNLNERYLYEMLVLETFQAGLSWKTILHKRANFRKAFADFDVQKVAHFDDQQFQRLMNDPGIIRNRTKIKAAINNARIVVKLGSFAKFLKQAVPHPIIHYPKTAADVPSQNQTSRLLAKKMKQVGFKFVGPTVLYSFLEGVGLINDHIRDCSFKFSTPIKEVEQNAH